MIAPISSFIPLFLLVSQIVATPNVVRRADSSSTTASTTEAPSPWVSIIDDGTPTTVTPVVSTNTAGQTTTINAEPTGKSDSTTDNSGGGTQDVFAKCDSTKYELTETGNTQPFIPFCAPHNGTKWWYSGNYYLTWNPGFYSRNSTVKIVLNYVESGGAGKVAQSWETSSGFGFINIEPDQKWLINQTALDDGFNEKLDNQTMYFTIADSNPSSTTDNIQSGPTIILTKKPVAPSADTSPRNRPSPSTLALAIGLPLIASFAFGSICCLHFCMRNKRKVGPISIGGGRKHFSKRGYSGRAERRRKAALGGQAAYRDEVDDGISASPIDERSPEWELANVKGGRQNLH